MREIKVLVPKGMSAEVAKLALKAGTGSATMRSVFVYGPDEEREEVKVKTSTPTARRFVDALLAAPYFDRRTISVSSHDIKALISDAEIADITKPLCIPTVDIFEDLWQNSHITQTFVVKVIAGALLMAYAMFKNDPVLMVGALLFTPFSPLLMGIAFGARAGDRHLIRQATLAFTVGNILTVMGALITASFMKGPLVYNGLGSLLSNFLISVIAGIVAGLTDADDVGRRQMIALAATIPYVKFPVWFGISCVKGFPDGQATGMHLLSFGINIATVLTTTWLVYAYLGIKHAGVHHFIPREHSQTAPH